MRFGVGCCPKIHWSIKARRKTRTKERRSETGALTKYSRCRLRDSRRGRWRKGEGNKSKHAAGRRIFTKDAEKGRVKSGSHKIEKKRELVESQCGRGPTKTLKSTNSITKPAAWRFGVTTGNVAQSWLLLRKPGKEKASSEMYLRISTIRREAVGLDNTQQKKVGTNRQDTIARGLEGTGGGHRGAIAVRNATTRQKNQ